MKKMMKQTSTISQEQEVLLKNWDKYKGNIVMVVGNEIFATKRANKVNKMLKEIEERYHKQSLITYIPKEGLLVF